ncbi:MAG TPA: HlyD family secretion protein [Candidatus Acidoferrum sp.]|nr:HlyD family secretion protein [Candidatus Acidoferrum sp.]
MEQAPNQTLPALKQDAGTPAKRSFWKRKPVVLVGTILVFGLLYFGLDYLADSLTHETTDDAFLDAHIVSVAPKVAGRVKQVPVKDNQPVKAGDLLVDIDPRDLAVQLEQKQSALNAARANLDVLKASLELRRAQVDTAEAATQQSSAEAAAAEATTSKAESDLKRAEDLIQKRTISPQEYDAAKMAAKAAEANLKAAHERTTSDESKIAEARAQQDTSRKALQWGEAQVHQAEADVQAAELNLSYTRLTAPVDGRVTKKAVEDGDYVQVGQNLMALVPPELFVTANYKETELVHMRPGQKVRITIDSMGGRAFAGHVDSIMAGSGARFSLLPPENAVGNFVKVVQRVPVKIVFDEPIEAAHVLGPGMSVEPSVHVKGYVIPEAAVIIASIVGALVLGALWWRAAGRGRAPA